MTIQSDYQDTSETAVWKPPPTLTFPFMAWATSCVGESTQEAS